MLNLNGRKYLAISPEVPSFVTLIRKVDNPLPLCKFVIYWSAYCDFNAHCFHKHGRKIFISVIAFLLHTCQALHKFHSNVLDFLRGQPRFNACALL